jgi:hypothetical protein
LFLVVYILLSSCFSDSHRSRYCLWSRDSFAHSGISSIPSNSVTNYNFYLSFYLKF